MDLSQLANLGEFIGGIAVLVTLIYLAMQVRQSNRLAFLSATQSMLDSYNHVVDQWYGDLEKTRVSKLGLRYEPAMSEEERMRFSAQLFTFYGWIESIYYHHQSGQVEDALANRAIALLKYYGRMTGVQEWWVGNLETLENISSPGSAQFTDEFVTFVESNSGLQRRQS